MSTSRLNSEKHWIGGNLWVLGFDFRLPNKKQDVPLSNDGVQQNNDRPDSSQLFQVSLLN